MRAHTHTHLRCVYLAYDVSVEDEILALFTLEVILTVERNINQWASGTDSRWANQCLRD